MRIYFINHLGGGFANHLDIAEGTTVVSSSKRRWVAIPPVT